MMVIMPLNSAAQYSLSVMECQSEEEAIALIDTVLLYNVDSIFKKNITITGDPRSIGYFSNGFIFGFDTPTGVALSTGFAGFLDNGNTCSSGNASSNTTGGSDADLTVMSGMSIYDACIIEFDLMLFNDSAYLSYIFGSEEYHEWVSSGFNDAFGFFLSGPGINGAYTNNAINIAVIPGTSNDVAVNSLNCGRQETFCAPPPGNGPNCDLLYDNTNSTLDSFEQFALDGFTLPLTTEQEIQSYEWYHFKLAIGDASDAVYDSGVLLEKGSIVSIPIPEITIAEGESESDVIEYVDNVLLSNVLEENKANISFSGDPKAIGYFTNTQFLHLDQVEGLLFSTGHAGIAAQTNICNSNASASVDNNGLDADDDLELISNENNLNDVSYIEFDFKPSDDTLTFNYVFASEEYHGAIDLGFYDVFGIFLSGPGIDGEFSNNAVNIATITDDDLPVNSNTINFGQGGFTCTETPNDCVNCEYLVDNTQKSDSAFFAMAYDGYTIPMNATYAVEPGEWYHIKIAIADALSDGFDSGIFLSEGTLVSDSLMTSVESDLFDESIKIRPNPAQNYVEIQNSGNEPIIEIVIYDLHGRALIRQPFNKEKISLLGLPKGILTLQLRSENKSAQFKLIHQ